ncbi:MAG: tRNA pseudouridine(38-40) synthase TruA [Chloroflexota bacterium]
MARYKVILAYDGTRYAGFQRQASANSVQLEVEAGLQRLGWQDRSILAAGRTDSGVHATGQVISFDLNWAHSSETLLQALNANLPDDIAAQAVSQAADDFHPRFDACAREYQYQIYFKPVRDPLKARTAWRVWPEPDRTLMNAAAADLIGEHDFAPLGRAIKSGSRTIRSVFEASWKTEQDGLLFNIRANAFLYHMVRRIVNVLVMIGQGKEEVRIIKRGLENGKINLVGLAPPQGLTLTGVFYKA